MAHTPGPWVWWWDGLGANLHLGTPDRGRLIVMDFVRRKMQGAIPRFAVWKGEERERMGGIMRPASELDLAKHPDAMVIQAAPDLLAALKGLWEWQGTVQALVPDDLSASVRAAIAKAEGRDAEGETNADRCRTRDCGEMC